MDISLHKKSPVEATITIQVNETDYQPHVKKRIREHSKKAHIKGFRPGHIPPSLIKQKYGHTILIETINTLLAESLPKYLQEHDIPMLGEPLPELGSTEEIDWANQREFEFKYSIGLVEEFDITLSKQLKLTAYKVNQVADKTVADITKNLIKAHGEMHKVTKSEVGDVLYGELSHPQGGLKVKTQFLTESIEGEEQKIFTSLHAQDKIMVDIRALLQQGIQPAGLTDKVLAEMLQLGNQFEFTVEQVGRPIPAELNQEFFEKVLGKGIAKSAAEFREKLRQQIIRNKQQEADLFLERSIQAVLLKNTKINLPDIFLKRGLQKKNATVSKEKIEKYYQQYAQDLRWQLIVRKIGKEHSLQVTPEAVVDEVKERFQALHQIPAEELEQLTQNFLQENKGNNYRRVYEELRVSKLMNFIKDKITIVTQEVSFEEFDRLMSN